MRERATTVIEESALKEPELTPVGHLTALLWDVRDIRALPEGKKDKDNDEYIELTKSAGKHAGAIIAANILDKLKVRDEIERVRKDPRMKELLPEALSFLKITNTAAGDVAKKDHGLIFRYRVNRRVRKNERLLGLK